MITLTPYRILVYLDMPQLFLSKDSLGTRYICLLYNSDEDAHVCVQASSARIHEFLNGEIDLKDIYTSPEQDESLFKASFNGQSLEAERISSDELSDDMLPEPGFFMTDQPPLSDEEDQILLYETEEQNAQVISLDFSNGLGRHEIEAGCLSSLLSSVKSIITSCQRKLYGKQAAKDMDFMVLATMPGSFDMHMKIGAEMNLFGSSSAEDALVGFSELVNPENDSSLRETLKKYRGHAVGSSRIFIDTLLKHNMSLEYRWVSSIIDRKISNGRADIRSLEHIASIYKEHKELEKENTEYEGVFLSSSVVNGRWKLRRSDNGRIVTGICEDPKALSGVTIESQQYKIYCEENAEQDPNTLAISRTITLTSYEPA